MLRRDLVIQIIANKIAELMSREGIPSYHHELLVSSLISAIHLDDLIDEKDAIKNLRSPLAIPDIISKIDRELVFYESSRPDITMITEMFKALQKVDINEESLESKLRATIFILWRMCCY
jgi:hypothetical protein